MKKWSKRILSMVLAICLSLTMLPAVTIQAEAATVTFSEMLARAEAIVNYTWIPNQRIYTWNGSNYNGKTYFESGETVVGMPYTLFSWELGVDSPLSLTQYQAKVSSNYSTTTYCNSVGANRTGPIYGSCCATFVSEVFGGSYMNGSNPRYDSVSAIKSDSSRGTTYTNVTATNILPGDALSNTSGTHIVWVGEVTDTYIMIYEQTPPVARKKVVYKTSVNSSGYLVYGGSVYSTVTRSNELVSTTTENYIDIGTGVYGVILNTAYWKPISNDDDCFVRLDSENGTASQVWRFDRQSDGSYLISSAKDGRVLEMYCGTTTNGNPVAAWGDDWGGAYQRWYIYKQGNGYILLNKHYSDLNMVLTLSNNDNTDGTEICTWTRNDETSQIWSIYT